MDLELYLGDGKVIEMDFEDYRAWMDERDHRIELTLWPPTDRFSVGVSGSDETAVLGMFEAIKSEIEHLISVRVAGRRDQEAEIEELPIFASLHTPAAPSEDSTSEPTPKWHMNPWVVTIVGGVLVAVVVATATLVL